MKITNYSKAYRFIHWALAISFTLLLLTIFLRLTWMNKYNMAAIIQDFLSDTDMTLSQEQLIALAKKIRQPMWDWHIYLGYIILGLFSLRFLFLATGHMGIRNPLRKNIPAKVRFQRWAYLVFYAFVIVSLVTGLFIVFGPKELKGSMESIHELGIYYLLAYLAIHLGGVFLAEFTTQKGIVSRIVSGSKDED